jgi:hypothetical protein
MTLLMHMAADSTLMAATQSGQPGNTTVTAGALGPRTRKPNKRFHCKPIKHAMSARAEADTASSMDVSVTAADAPIKYKNKGAPAPHISRG